MRNALLVATMIAMLSTPCHADGLPFDEERTRLTIPSIRLLLSPQQKREVSRRRTLTLTHEQWARLKKKGRGTPRVLDVLTNRYNNCTCGPGVFAVWFRSGEVEIPINLLPESHLDSEEAGQIQEDRKSFGIVVDEDLIYWIRGKAYSEGRVLQELSSWALTKEALSGRDDKGWIDVTLAAPPILSSGRELKLRQRIARLRRLAAPLRISLFAYGFPQTAE